MKHKYKDKPSFSPKKEKIDRRMNRRGVRLPAFVALESGEAAAAVAEKRVAVVCRGVGLGWG